MDNSLNGATMEIFKDIEHYEGIYQVSNLGNVKSLTRYNQEQNATIKGKEKTQSDHTHGYKKVSLWKDNKGKDHYVHRLVARAFIGVIPNKYHINHKDCNKINNHISNLEIITARENILHAIANGRRKPQVGKPFKNSKSGFTNISPKFVRGRFMWNCCLRINGKRFDKTSQNIYEMIVYYNARARDNRMDTNLLHKLTQKDIELYGNGHCSLLKV